MFTRYVRLLTVTHFIIQEGGRIATEMGENFQSGKRASAC